MPHSSGGGSHGGGYHGGGGGGHGGGGNAPRYSSRPFLHSRRFRYYDRNGAERFLYSDRVPEKTSIASLIVPLIFLIPFAVASISMLVSSLGAFVPLKPLTPVYKSPEVHIQDSADVIDNEDSLEEVLQEFEDLTGISPYVMTVYDSDWKYYNDLEDFAYSEYLHIFSDEQHFLIVYSEPEDAEELDFVDWSWEAIQGDDTDPIITESNFERFADDLHDDFLRENVSVGEAFENAFRNSLSYIMKKNYDDAKSMVFGAIFWIAIAAFAIGTVIRSFIIGRRKYQEMPHDQNNAKKYVKSSVKPIITALFSLGIVLLIVKPLMLSTMPILLSMFQIPIEDGYPTEVKSVLIVLNFILMLVIILAVVKSVILVFRHVFDDIKREYVEVPMNSESGAQYNVAGAADADYYNDEAKK